MMQNVLGYTHTFRNGERQTIFNT